MIHTIAVGAGHIPALLTFFAAKYAGTVGAFWLSRPYFCPGRPCSALVNLTAGVFLERCLPPASDSAEPEFPNHKLQSPWFVAVV